MSCRQPVTDVIVYDQNKLPMVQPGELVVEFNGFKVVSDTVRV